MNASEAIVGIVFYGGLLWLLLSHWKSRPVDLPRFKNTSGTSFHQGEEWYNMLHTYAE